MSGFQLDTSGVVRVPVYPTSAHMMPYAWDDLSPFAQGHIEALFETCADDLNNAAKGHFAGTFVGETLSPPDWAFSDLAPSALALILKDCASAARLSVIPFGRLYNDNAAGGACFWQDRQRSGELADFPPLAVTLGEDGKVYLEAAP